MRWLLETDPQVADVLRTSHHAFPVVDSGGRLVGLVARAALQAWTGLQGHG